MLGSVSPSIVILRIPLGEMQNPDNLASLQNGLSYIKLNLYTCPYDLWFFIRNYLLRGKGVRNLMFYKTLAGADTITFLHLKVLCIVRILTRSRGLSSISTTAWFKRILSFTTSANLFVKLLVPPSILNSCAPPIPKNKLSTPFPDLMYYNAWRREI